MAYTNCRCVFHYPINFLNVDCIIKYYVIPEIRPNELGTKVITAGETKEQLFTLTWKDKAIEHTVFFKHTHTHLHI